MNDPKRLREAGSDNLAAALLEAGRADTPSKSRLDRMLGGIAGTGAVLGSQVAAASSATLATGALTSSAVSFALILKWLGLGALAGIALSAAADRIQPLPRDASAEIGPAVASTSARSAQHPADPPSWARPQPERAATPAGPANSFASRFPETHRAASSAATPSAHEPSDDAINPEKTAVSSEAQSLREEVAALGLAKAALNHGAPGVALEAVRAYRARYGAGRLGPEATYIEMEAELALGHRQRAVEIAEQVAAGATPNAERAQAILQGR